jgi:peptide/nickel transport system ATP-binding protein
MAIIGLLAGGGRVAGGSIRLDGKDITRAPESELRAIRGRDIGLVPQDPMSNLNPVAKIGTQVAETLLAHGLATRQNVKVKVVEALSAAGLPDPERRAKQYPHEFSGGMRQRVMIAIAIANDPEVLIADEPTTALDVTVQAQILDVIQEIQHKFRAGVVFITHDLGVVARIADRVQVMYAGRTVERGDVESIFKNPTHPYTRGLLASLPALGRERLTPIPGAPPNMLRPPSGCAFRPRCPYAEEICAGDIPELHPLLGLETACVRAEDLLPAESMS